jgi:hypothetical protein
MTAEKSMWHVVKALPSIHRKMFTWHPGREVVLEDILRAADGAASLGPAWFDAFLPKEIVQARARREQTQPPMTPYEIGFGEATRIRYERFERAALAHDNHTRSEECRRRVLASVGAPVNKGWQAWTR